MRPEVDLWWSQAQEDLVTARVNAEAGRHYAAVFFLQQAVEKALKALHIHLNRKPAGPTHSLVALGQAVGIPGEHLPFLRALTPAYTATRYPDISDEIPARLYDGPIVGEHTARTEEVLAWVAKRLR